MICVCFREITNDKIKEIDMKKVYSVIFLPFLIILLLVTPVFGSDWVEYGRSKSGSVFLYNKVNIKHRTRNIVQVWCRLVFSKEDRENRIQNRRNRGVSTEGYDKLSHALLLNEINCKKLEIHTLSITEYDTDGSVLYSRSSDKSDWSYIPPDTIWDKLRKTVCK